VTLRLVVAALLTSLVACPAAAGHGDGAARGYKSRVTSVQPSLAGLAVEVVAGDDQLRLHNETGVTVVVEGYDGEPYLRFAAAGGVFRNAHSPATYLNEDRYGAVAVPASASKSAGPRWERVADDHRYAWHDHRIHWMSRIDPPKVRAAKDKRHHVFDWTVPATAGGKPLAIRGSLDYAPPPKGSFNALLIVPLVALGVMGAIVWWARRRRALRA
jgi:hypothetical protein